jgi:UrcA family protein
MRHFAISFRPSALIRTVCIGLAAGFVGQCPLAVADSTEVHVDLRAYNFSQPADVKRLYRQLELAAQSACGDRYITGSHIPSLAWRKCVTATLDQAIARVDRQTLSTYHLRTRGHVDTAAAVAALHP